MNENDTTQPRRLVRTRQGRLIGGVCSGAAAYFGWDANLIRLGLAVATVITGGTIIAAYVIAWLIIPEEDKDTSIAQDLVTKVQQKSQNKPDKTTPQP